MYVFVGSPTAGEGPKDLSLLPPRESGGRVGNPHGTPRTGQVLKDPGGSPTFPALRAPLLCPRWRLRPSAVHALPRRFPARAWRAAGAQLTKGIHPGRSGHAVPDRATRGQARTAEGARDGEGSGEEEPGVTRGWAHPLHSPHPRPEPSCYPPRLLLPLFSLLLGHLFLLMAPAKVPGVGGR